jgi:hypothetical protein
LGPRSSHRIRPIKGRNSSTRIQMTFAAVLAPLDAVLMMAQMMMISHY